MAKSKSKEIGVSGIKVSAGVIQEDYNSKMLSTSKRWDEFARIHNDSHVTQVRNAMMLPVMQADFFLEHDEDDPEAVEIAEFVESQLFDRENQSWNDLLRVCLKYIFDGVVVLEKTYENVQWAQEGKTKKFYTGIKSVAYRHPRTITRWIIENSVLQAIEQQAPSPDDGAYINVEIPVDKLIILVNNQVGDNYEGEAFYRVIWKNFTMKEQAEKAMAMYLERVAGGIVDISHPGNLSTDELTRLENMAKNYRASEYGYFIHNADVEFNIQSIQGGSTETLVNAINYHVEAISKGMLVQFLNLGSTATGNRATSADHSDFFLLAVQSIADNLADKLTKMLVNQLCAYNWDSEKYKDKFPVLKARQIKKEDSKMLADTFQVLTNIGILSSTRLADVEHIRKQMMLPEMTDEDIKEMEKLKNEMDAIRAANPLVSGQPNANQNQPAGNTGNATQGKTDDEEQEKVDAVSKGSEDSPVVQKNPESPKTVVDMQKYFDGLGEDKRKNVLTGIYGAYQPEQYEDVRKYSESRLAAIDGRNTSIQKRVKTKVLNVITDFQKKVLDKAIAGESVRGIKAANYQTTVKSLAQDYKDAYEWGYEDYEIDYDRHAGRMASERVKVFADPKWLKRILDEAETSMGVGLRRIEDSAELAIRRVERLGLSGFERVNYLTEAIMTLSDNVMTMGVKALVNIAYGEGRLEAVKAFKPKLEVYSAAFDRNTCIECAYRDGQIHEPGDPRYLTRPNQTHCLGGDNCRCVSFPYEV